MPASQILPLLWIGDEYAAKTPEVHKFGCVLNITIEVDECSALVSDVLFQRFSIFDFGGDKQQQTMFNFFSEACALIERAIAEERMVLVHCVEGKQRSCAVVAAYLILAKGFTPAQAKEHIVKNRPEAFNDGTHVNFAPALERWHETSRSRSTSEKENRFPADRSCSSSQIGGSKAQLQKSKNKPVPPKNARKR